MQWVGWFRQWWWGVSVLALVACNNPGASSSTPLEVGQAAGVAAGQGGSSATPGSSPVFQFGFDESSLTRVEPDGEGGEGGDAGQENTPQAPSTRCGDAIVGLNAAGVEEECDDGDEGSDACTAACQTRDQLVVPAPQVAPIHRASRVQGLGRHPLAGGSSGFVSIYTEPDGDEPLVAATVFNQLGQPKLRGAVSTGSLPINDANPVAAALPHGEYALAWNDFGGDGSDLGIALRKVKASGDLTPLRAANQATEFTQSDPDMLWAGGQLVVAWVDYADANRGPDIRYRLFDADLSPLGDDIALADSVTWEADVALASFGGGWAAAYREGTADGRENVVVKSGEQTWRVGPVLGGPAGEKPALVELDSTHLLVAFSEGTDPKLSGVANTPRLRYAVVDTAVAAPTPIRALTGPDSYSSQQLLESQTSPALERGLDGVYFAWRVEANPADAAGDQIWLKSLGWSPRGPNGELELEEHAAELLIPRLCESSTGDQRAPALASSGLYPNGALAIAWDDYSHSVDANSNGPDVLVHYAPNHAALQGAAPQVVTETWTGTNLEPWPARWQVNYEPARTRPNIYEGSGQFHSLGGPTSSSALLVEPIALNTDMVVTARMNLTSMAVGAVARRSDDDPSSYFLAKLSSISNDVWRIQVVNAGVATDVATLPQPQNFYLYTGNNVSYRLRFRATTNADGSVFLGMKGWVLGATEPANWQLAATLPADSPLLLQLGSRPGHFGLFEQVASSGRDAFFDDFRALYFRGRGDLDAARDEARLPLLRSAAQYRTCRPGSECLEAAAGCCTSKADCGPNLDCLATQGNFRGFGSHASVCSPSHCGNLSKDADEVFADAGGNECEPRQCTPTVASGEHGYCTQACPCGIGEADCIMDGNCLPGLTCGRYKAEQYGGVAGYDACVPPHCVNRVLDPGETVVDCGGSCGNNCDCSVVNGDRLHCMPRCPCTVGNGPCERDDECAGGLLCAPKVGSLFGMGSLQGVCLPPACSNGKKDTALGETSIDWGGPCGAPTGLTLAEAMVDFPTLQYRKVSYGLETNDYMVVPTPAPLAGQVTSPVFQRANRFLFNVPVAADTSLTFNVGNVGLTANPTVELKLYNYAGTLVKSATLPSNSVAQTVSTVVALGRLGGNYELDLIPGDPSLTYSITRTITAVPNLAVKDGVDLTGPATPLYFYVPAEVDMAFLLGNLDPAAGVHFFYEPTGAEIAPLQITPNKLYALDTRGKPGVWRTTFKTTSLRAHLVNLPDVFSFSPNSVFGNKIIRTPLDFGVPSANPVVTHYLRNENKFLFHVATASSPKFILAIEDSLAPPRPPSEVRLQNLDGSQLPGSPFLLPLGLTNEVSAGPLQPGDYELYIPSPASTMRYVITAPAGVPFVSVDGFNTGNVWLASNRNFFYVPPGTTSVRFAASSPASVFVIYNPNGTVVANQPVALGNSVYEIQGTTPGTWAMNVKGQSVIRMLNLTQAIGFSSTIKAAPQASPPFTCTSNANCPSNQICGADNGARFGRPSTDDLCWPANCAPTPPANLCGSVLSPCGTCP